MTDHMTSETPPARGGGVEEKSSALRVLIVDDVQENLELLEDVLSEHGYHSIAARNGVEALELMKSGTIHLIVADAMMPRMDGFQLCKEVRALPGGAAIPFVIYTGNYVDAADRDFARSIGVDRYVVKYAGLGTLVEAVDELAAATYGRAPADEGGPKEQIDDRSFLEGHHAIVIKKLEEKMTELEMYAETLVRKNSEIQASEERFRGLFDHASIAIFVVDRAQGRVVDVNAQGMALLGYTRDEIVAMPSLPFAGHDDFAPKVLTADTAIAGESAFLTKSGRVLQVEIGVSPITQPQDPRLLLYVRDITEEKRMQDQLIQYEKMTIMGRLAAGIAHEIRNPLSAISLNLQYLVQKYQANEELRETLKDALEGAKRVETVIENTLNLARITPPVLKPERINDLVDQVSGFVRISVRQKDIQIETRLVDELPAIMADAKQIQQVILNIVQNAIDASPEGGCVELSTGRVMAPPPGGGPDVEGVVVSVRDHGAGVAPEDRARLFEHFFTTKRTGTGLGLALSKQIMQRHQGDITLDAAEGGGTIATLLFRAISY
jgi:PAS domain S-box-containing protein